MTIRRMAARFTAATALVCTLVACGPPSKPAQVAPTKARPALSPLQERYWVLDGGKRCRPSGTLAKFVDEHGCFARDQSRRGNSLGLPDALNRCGVVNAMLRGDTAIANEATALARDAISLTDSEASGRTFEIDCDVPNEKVAALDIVKQSIAFLALAGDEGDAPRLLALLKDPRVRELAKKTPTLANGIARAVANLGSDEVVDELIGVLMTDLDMKREAVEVATARGHRGLVDACYGAWKGSKVGLSNACLNYLVRVDVPADVPQLLHHLSRSRSATAARLLGRTGDARHVAALEAAMAKAPIADRPPFLVALINLGQDRYWNELARLIEPRRHGYKTYARHARALNEATLLRDGCQLERVKASLRRVSVAPKGYRAVFHSNAQTMLAALGEPASMETVVNLLASKVPAVRRSVLDQIRGFDATAEFAERGATRLVDERFLPALLKLRDTKTKNRARRENLLNALFDMSGDLRRSPTPGSTSASKKPSHCPETPQGLFDPVPVPGGRKLVTWQAKPKGIEIELPDKPVFGKTAVPFFESTNLSTLGDIRWTTGERDPVVRYKSERCRRQSTCFFTVMTWDYVYVTGTEQAALDDYSTALLKVSGGALVESRPVEVEARPGREGLIHARQSGREAMVRFRLYLADGLIHMLVSVEDWSNTKGELVTHVFDSFQLLPD